jgi:sirohydrochlorin cobaltochelatase
MNSGLILFAHGARDPRWATPFEAVAGAVRAARPGLPVRLAFLEFMTPTLPAAGAELAAAGCNSITVLPMFLGAGGHVRKDLPLLLDELRQAHPGLGVTLQPAIGEIDSVVAAMAQAALAQLGNEPTAEPAR